MPLLSPTSQELLNELIRHQRCSQTYIFYGTPASFLAHQAKTFALEWFKFNNTYSKLEMCPDFIEVIPEKSISIDDIRQVQDQVKYGATKGNKRFILIHKAHQLTIQASNGFLKTLEESHSDNCFILLTHQFHSILPTIQSRCQTLFVPDVPLPSIQHQFKNSFPNHPDSTILSDSLRMAIALESNQADPEPLTDFQDFHKLSLYQRFKFMESLSNSPDRISQQCNLWIQQISSNYQNRYQDFLTALLTLVPKLNSPIQKKAHLENLCFHA